MDVADLVLAAAVRLPGTRRVAAVLLAACPAVHACGFEDPDSIAMRRGALNVAFPQSLHVVTAVWQAQRDGRLPGDPVALRGELAPPARQALRRLRANAALARFGTALGVPPAAGPSLALVLLGPAMWSRFEPAGAGARAAIHVDGPQPGDVVVVTEVAVLEALAGGSITAEDALRGGLVRLYGRSVPVQAALRWLGSLARG